MSGRLDRQVALVAGGGRRAEDNPLPGVATAG
jgi:hypothetical protein